MSEIHLNDLSKIYKDQIAEKKDDSYLETDMKKRQKNNEKARKDMEKMGTSMKNPHFEEKRLDPVGQEDGDVDNDGDKDSSDKYLMKRRKAIGKAIAKTSKKKMDESISDWRKSLSEVMTDDIESKPIKEKKVNNKITINPKLGEAVEEIGGTLIEMVEIDEVDYIVESVYDELLEEGYSEDHIEEAIEHGFLEATVTMGHDTPGKSERKRDKLKAAAKSFMGKMGYKAYHAARDAKRAAEPSVRRAMTSAKRGVRKMALKVADKLKEENVDEAVYGGDKKPAPTDKRLTVTNADKAGNTPAYQKYKAGDKNYKAADHMKEGVRDEDPEKGTAERKARLEKKRGMKMDDHPQYKKEEVELDENRRAARAAGGYKDDSKKQPDPSKKGFTGIGNMSIDQIRKMSARIEKEKVNEGSEGMESAKGQQIQKKQLELDRKKLRLRMQAAQKKQATAADTVVEKHDCAHNPKGKDCPVHGMDACPAKEMSEGKELSIDDQMRISREANAKRKPYQPGDRQKQRAAQIKQMAKNAAKDTRTDAQKMTDATGPRPGSRYRGD